MSIETLFNSLDGSPSISLSAFIFEKSVGQGTWAAVVNGSYFNGTYYGNANADGDNVSFYKYFIRGTYSFIVNFTKGTNFGIIDVYIGSQKIMTYDSYAAAASYSSRAVVNNIEIPEGFLVLKFQVNGKNDSSGGYYCRFCSFSFERTG